MVVDNYYGSKFKVVFWVPWWAVHRAGSHLASEVVLVEFTKPKRHGYILLVAIYILYYYISLAST
jgi:hypothetical protein